MVRRILTITVAILSWAAIACGRVPIIVNAPRHQMALGKMVNNGEEQLNKGDLAGANRTLDAVLKADPAFWPALYTRARIFVMEGKYERAIEDCNEALRKYRGFVEARCYEPKSMRTSGSTPKPRRSLTISSPSPASRYSSQSVEAARVVSGDLSRLIISQRSTGSQRREGRL